ncbi:MAG TPA: 50S ribosomal protein L35 [Anaerolineae bacterium]|nr:50S ribosomal protein L35 [Anaerolineae bacterium]
MPKLKTYKAAAKRFKITKNGKILRRKAGGTHLRRKKSKRSLQSYKKDHRISKSDRQRIKRLLAARL